MRYALHLSNTWLDALSDLEAADQGLLEPTLQAVPLQPLFARLQEGFAPRFSALGLDFRVVSTGAVVRADPDLLRRLLTLLLDNAAKRSEEHTSELQSLLRTSYAVFCLTKKKKKRNKH